MAKLKWGLKAAAEEMDDQGFYDGPVPPKGRYICAIKRLQVKETQAGDNRFNGLLEIRDPRPGKKQYNGYAFWLGVNVTAKSVKFVTNFIKQGLGVPFKDLAEFDKIVELDSTDLPANVKWIGIGRNKVVFEGKEPLIVVNTKRRRQNDDPDGDWELTTDDFAPAFPGIDPKKLAAEDAAADDDEDEDEDEEDEEDEDEEDEDEEEDALTREELEEMGLAELRELAAEEGVMTKAQAAKAKKSALVDVLAPDEDEDEDEDEEEEEEEEPPPPPRKVARKTATKTTKTTRTTRRR